MPSCMREFASLISTRNQTSIYVYDVQQKDNKNIYVYYVKMQDDIVKHASNLYRQYFINP